MAAPTPQPHNRGRKQEDDEEEEDPVDQMISRTGCTALHYAVQECMAEHGDWRRCQEQVQNFRNCMQDHQKRRMEELRKKMSNMADPTS
ncbi:cytochrome c oxidase assembly factor 4 homolog, mitochondrial [Hyla sarda]|uniref:cytochrome c oxidase assembly factor 4 homolog, mitochondrial n=1 Tax=Hyla sarda TaxID=327740 RepID=UPI0024C35AC8|nr:cytochrome c oxidase assembly factor 4 homolog, mitochondrial [Hyla sarda]XP_056417115.1 cytochrome c oxidase assembly factor 4 homolog, mitochondrial [Hyla sarda]XP_056417116.1 cytochrome c oxidase assembly factor 4 homolog, mitochondrial [Hyla sarda]